MRSVIAGITPDAYQPNRLHAATRDWPETNCYVDLWIELLHARGLDPRAGLGFTVGLDFEGDQFTFFKFPPQDLATLYGARVFELSIYDSVEAHVCEQISRGRMTLVEVDAFHLPDTRGVSYGLEHTKTTIAINALDADARRMHYFHNAGFFLADGADFDAIFQRTCPPDANNPILFPYVEFVKFDGTPLIAASLKQAASHCLAQHLATAPRRNPVREFANRIEAQAESICLHDATFFHKYAFNTLRQIGANFELLATHLDWLSADEFTTASTASRALSTSAKTFQFQLARAVARRRFAGLAQLLDGMAENWDVAIDDLRDRVKV